MARSPGIFILVPLLITLLMGSGVQQFNYMSDVFYLFVPVDAKSIQDHSRLQDVFPENLTRYILLVVCEHLNNCSYFQACPRK